MNFKIDFDNVDLMDLHMHTTYSDGEDKPSAMLRAAARLGLKVIGISDHSYTYFDESYCIGHAATEDYMVDLHLMKERCRQLPDNPRLAKSLGCSDLHFYAGIEQDYYSNEPTDGYDYVIGSVHYILVNYNGQDIPEGCYKYLDHIYVPVDEKPEILKNAADAFYDGDIYALIRDYYLVVSDVVNRTGADIIGHFDLISKFNESGDIFDPEDPRYIKAWQGAADALLKTDCVFEINYGAVTRGYRSVPYPAADIQQYLKERGGRFIYSSDAHSTSGLRKW